MSDRFQFDASDDPGIRPEPRDALVLRPAVLLDRDGTIIVEKDYLCDPDQAFLEVGAADGLRRIVDLGFVLVVVSNQSGIGRGKFPIERAEEVNARVADLLAAEGVTIAGWYMCPHAPSTDCQCRKPRAGMALAAAAEHGLDLAHSFVIGDKRSDVELAMAVGGTGILVTTGHGAHDLAWAEANGAAIAASLVEAATLIARILDRRLSSQGAGS